MTTKRSKRQGSLRFRIVDHGPVASEPAVLSDKDGWCWQLLENDGARLHPAVIAGFGVIGIGVFEAPKLVHRQRLWAACVLTLVFEGLDDHRVAPSQTAIAEALNDAGVFTFEGNPWRRQSVDRLLKRYELADRLGDYRYINNLAWSQWLQERPKSGSQAKSGIYHGPQFAGRKATLRQMREEAGIRTNKQLLKHHGFDT